MDLILPVRPNISYRFETHWLRVMFVGIICYCCDGFFPLYLLVKVNFLMSSDNKSTFCNHLIPTTLMLDDGYFPLNVTSFSEEPPLFHSNWISSYHCIFYVLCTGQTIINIYILLYNVIDLRKFHCRHTCCFEYLPFWLDSTWRHIIYKNVLIAYLQVSHCCLAHFAICTYKSTNILLAVEQGYTSF